MSTETDALAAAEAALKIAIEAAAHVDGAAPVEPVKPGIESALAPIELAAVAAVQAAIVAARTGAKNVGALRAAAHDLVDQVTRV